MDDKKIQWKEVVVIPFTASAIFLLAIIFGVSGNGGAPLVSEIIIAAAYTLLPFVAALLVAFFVKSRRILHFFIALVVAWVILGVMFSLSRAYSRGQEVKVVQEIRKNDSQMAIVESSAIKKGGKYFADIVIYVKSKNPQTVLDEDKSVVEIRLDKSLNSKILGSGKVFPAGAKRIDGEVVVVYRSRFEFMPDEGWKNAIVVVKGENGKIEFGEIKP